MLQLLKTLAKLTSERVLMTGLWCCLAVEAGRVTHVSEEPCNAFDQYSVEFTGANSGVGQFNGDCTTF